jgi:hypothetical protein
MNPQSSDPSQDGAEQPEDSVKSQDALQLGSIAMSDPVAMHNPLATMEPGEQVICEIKRHPIGILADYVAIGFGLLILAIAIFVILPHVLVNSSSSQVFDVGAMILIVFIALAGGFLFVAHRIYWGNRWIVTSDSITQVTQTGLFTKQSSQLSFEHLEDVTCEQNGMAAEMFHFGVLSAETAGAVDKFTFPYCPNPTTYAKQILAARERFEQRTDKQA